MACISRNLPIFIFVLNEKERNERKKNSNWQLASSYHHIEDLCCSTFRRIMRITTRDSSIRTNLSKTSTKEIIDRLNLDRIHRSTQPSQKRASLTSIIFNISCRSTPPFESMSYILNAHFSFFSGFPLAKSFVSSPSDAKDQPRTHRWCWSPWEILCKVKIRNKRRECFPPVTWNRFCPNYQRQMCGRYVCRRLRLDHWERIVDKLEWISSSSAHQWDNQAKRTGMFCLCFGRGRKALSRRLDRRQERSSNPR